MDDALAESCSRKIRAQQKEIESLREQLAECRNRSRKEALNSEEVKCKYCGQDTMHMGNVCYRCAHTDTVTNGLVQ